MTAEEAARRMISEEGEADIRGIVTPWPRYHYLIARAFLAQAERLKEAVEALREIDALEPLEINPSNYNHDDVCELKPCPLCHCPHVNTARRLNGDPEQVFCKACGCSAPIAAWNTRPAASTIRREALEEAAKICEQVRDEADDGGDSELLDEAADRIRALQEPKP